jgi:hypothetical protein
VFLVKPNVSHFPFTYLSIWLLPGSHQFRKSKFASFLHTVKSSVGQVLVFLETCLVQVSEGFLMLDPVLYFNTLKIKQQT